MSARILAKKIYAVFLVLSALGLGCTRPPAPSFSPESKRNPMNLAGTETGNPVARVLTSVCQVLNRCHGVDPTACNEAVQSVNGMDVKLGLPPNTASPLSVLIQSVDSGAIPAVSSAATACSGQIEGLSCDEPAVQSGYDPLNLSNPYSGVPNMIPQTSGSCPSVAPVPPSAPPGVSPLQSATGHLVPWTTTAVTIPLSSPSRQGSLLVAVVGSTRGTSPIQITDNLGQTYLTASYYYNSATHLDIYYVSGTRSGVTSITVTYADTNNAGDMVVAEYSGFSSGGVPDQTNTGWLGYGSTNDWSVSAPGPTTSPNELLLGTAFLAYSSGPASFTAGAGWAPRAAFCGAEGCIFLEDRFVSSIGTYQATGSSSILSPAVAITTFK